MVLGEIKLLLMKPIFAFLATVVLLSCGLQIYKSADFDNVLSRHKTVAILPSEVTIQLRPNQAKSMTAEQIEDLHVKTAYNIQEKMQGSLLRRGEKFN